MNALAPRCAPALARATAEPPAEPDGPLDLAPLFRARRDRAIVAACAAGDTYGAIGRLFGLTAERVQQLAKAAGLPRRRNGRRPNDDQGCRANAGDEAAPKDVGAVEPVSRPAAGRTAAATSEPMDVTAGETAPVPQAPPARAEPVEVRAGAPTTAERLRAEVAAECRPREERLRAAAVLSTFSIVPAAGERPVERFAAAGTADTRPFALSRDPCPRCQVRGDLGCKHQRPMERA